MVSNLTLKSLINFEFILVFAVRMLSNFIFVCICPIFPRPFIEQSILTHCMFVLLCEILIDYKGMGLFLVSQFCSTDLYVCFYVSPMLFDYYDLAVLFDIRQCEFPNFVHFSQDCQGYSRSYVVPYKFLQYLLQFCEICHDIDRNCVESIDCFGVCGYFNNVNSSHP